MRVLVTNDDGVRAPGIAVLARALAEEGHELTVVAPLEDASGSGTGTGPQRREQLDRFTCRHVELGGLAAFGVGGPPALCVTAGCAGAFGPSPEVVLAGVNAGRNVGRSVLHSGTVGAALTAAQLGLPAIAASVQSVAGRRPCFETAAWLACRLLPLAAVSGPLVLSCNAPARTREELAGVRAAPLGDAPLVRAARLRGEVLELEFLRGLEIGGADTDELLTDAGYATVTPLSPALGVAGDGLAGLTAALVELERELSTARSPR